MLYNGTAAVGMYYKTCVYYNMIQWDYRYILHFMYYETIGMYCILCIMIQWKYMYKYVLHWGYIEDIYCETMKL